MAYTDEAMQVAQILAKQGKAFITINLVAYANDVEFERNRPSCRVIVTARDPSDGNKIVEIATADIQTNTPPYSHKFEIKVQTTVKSMGRYIGALNTARSVSTYVPSRSGATRNGMRQTLRSVADLDTAFAAVSQQRAGGIHTVQDGFTNSHRTRIIALVTKSRLPGMYESRDWADAGGLIAYGPSYSELYRRAAHFVDKILKGAKPADLPIEQRRSSSW